MLFRKEKRERRVRQWVFFYLTARSTTQMVSCERRVWKRYM